MAVKEGWHWSIKQEIQVQFLCCVFTVWVSHVYSVISTMSIQISSFLFFICVWSEGHNINQVYIYICHFVFPSIFSRKENTFGNKMNVLWLLIRNSHLTLALKPLSNKKLLHKRKCYKRYLNSQTNLSWEISAIAKHFQLIVNWIVMYNSFYLPVHPTPHSYF